MLENVMCKVYITCHGCREREILEQFMKFMSVLGMFCGTLWMGVWFRLVLNEKYINTFYCLNLECVQ